MGKLVEISEENYARTLGFVNDFGQSFNDALTNLFRTLEEVRGQLPEKPASAGMRDSANVGLVGATVREMVNPLGLKAGLPPIGGLTPPQGPGLTPVPPIGGLTIVPPVGGLTSVPPIGGLTRPPGLGLAPQPVVIGPQTPGLDTLVGAPGVTVGALAAALAAQQGTGYQYAVPTLIKTSEHFRTSRNIFLPLGAQLKGVFRGQGFDAVVTANGINVLGQFFDNPSAAAVAVKKSLGADDKQAQSNGWTFWQIEYPAGSAEWRPLNVLREVQTGQPQDGEE